MRREARPPERATLTCRLIDRPMRPLFPGWLRDDLQIVATCMSLDERVPPDVLAVTGASMATLLAKIPFMGPMAAVRVGLLGDDFILNPSFREIERSELDLVVAGTPSGVVMVEAGANQLPEQDVIEAIDFGYEAVGELIRAQLALLKELGIEQVLPEERSEDPALPTYLEKECAKGIGEVLKQFDQTKTERDEKLDAIKAEVAETIAALDGEDPIKVAVSGNGKLLGNTYKSLTKKLMRQQILVEG
jgi:polyribonucleotide nucleotidyltransferase